jgi:hypothetical protein
VSAAYGAGAPAAGALSVLDPIVEPWLGAVFLLTDSPFQQSVTKGNNIGVFRQAKVWSICAGLLVAGRTNYLFFGPIFAPGLQLSQSQD